MKSQVVLTPQVHTVTGKDRIGNGVGIALSLPS